MSKGGGSRNRLKGSRTIQGTNQGNFATGDRHTTTKQLSSVDQLRNKAVEANKAAKQRRRNRKKGDKK
jgi:hypothetical protein